MNNSLREHWLAFKEFFARYQLIFQHVWKDRRLLDAVRFTREEAEFLPAALAIQEMPVSPAPRAMMWVLVSLVAVTLLWSIIGEIDVVAVAHGKVILNGKTKVIQSMEAGTVSKILVKDGDVVKAGDVLLELDGRSAVADVQRVESEILSLNLQAERARFMLEGIQQGRLPAIPLRSGDLARINESKRLLEWQFEEYRSHVASIEADIAKRRAELTSVRALVTKLELTAPIARQRAEDFKRLVESSFVSQHGYLEREQNRIEQEGDLENLRGRRGELEASLVEGEVQLRRLYAETRRAAQDSLNDARQKIASLEQDQLKADTHVQSLRITSPVDGAVQQLDVNTVGGVVSPAQKLMLVVPSGDALEAEVLLPNKDVGFVRPGQPVALKIDTFEYTKYGVLPGTVSTISRDAINDEKNGLVYAMRVGLKRSWVEVDHERVSLTPGMAVSAEIKIGSRKVLEYFLSPLMQYASESLGER